MYEIFRYSDLLRLFVRRDFVALYKQTILGPLWFFIQPLITAYTYYLVLTKMGGLETDGIPPFLFYVSGITIWNYFKACLLGTANTFTVNADMFGKVYFPRIIVPLSVIVSQFISFCIQFILLLAIIIYFHYSNDGYSFHFSWHLLLIPIMVFFIALLGLSMGLLVSSLTKKYRDLQQLLNFGVQLLMYFSAVIVSIDQTSQLSGTASKLIEYNPIAQFVSGFKSCVLSIGGIDWNGLVYAIVVTIVLFFLSVLSFNRTEKDFIDTV